MTSWRCSEDVLARGDNPTRWPPTCYCRFAVAASLHQSGTAGFSQSRTKELMNKRTWLNPGKTMRALLLPIGTMLMLQSSARAATLSVTPSLISNTYGGVIQLNIGGLTNGETVIVRKWLD